MSRHIHPCLTCEPDLSSKFGRNGFTRHADRVCSACRRRGVTNRDGVLTVPIEAVWTSIDDGRTADHYPGRYA